VQLLHQRQFQQSLVIQKLQSHLAVQQQMAQQSLATQLRLMTALVMKYLEFLAQLLLQPQMLLAKLQV
jgi:hypothetical protein